MNTEPDIFLFADKVNKERQQTLISNIASHHLLVVGQTGSGKTTTTLTLLSQLQHQDQTTIVFDPTGEYAQLPNAITYRLGGNAYLAAGTLSANELQEVLKLQLSSRLQDKLQQAVTALRIQYNIVEAPGIYKKLGQQITAYQQQLDQLKGWAVDYQPLQLFNQLIEEYIIPYPDERANYNLLGQEYDRQAIAREWGILTTIREKIDSAAFSTIFDPHPHPGTFKTELGFVLNLFLNQRSMHRTLVIDLSLLKDYEESQRVLISFLMKKILQLRLQKPQTWAVNIVIDEAHRYLPASETQLADNGIFQVLREGRKLNLKVILTTQSPLDLPARLRSQFSNILVHRLVADDEINSIALSDYGDRIKCLEVGKICLKVLDQVLGAKVQSPSWWKK